MTARIGPGDARNLVAEISHDIDQLAREASDFYGEVVRPRWDIPGGRCPQTLYAFMMASFAKVDILATLWNGGTKEGLLRDGERDPYMVAFLRTFLPEKTEEACAVVVEMWRNGLMHTGRPRLLIDRVRGHSYRWLLHWSQNEMLPEQHFQIVIGPESRKINTALLLLVGDLRQACDRYQSQLDQDEQFQRNALKAARDCLERRRFLNYRLAT